MCGGLARVRHARLTAVGSNVIVELPQLCARTVGPFLAKTRHMKGYACSCGNTIYFDSTQCLRCGKAVGFFWAQGAIHPIAGEVAEWDGTKITRCSNWATGICNWYAAGETPALCHSCALTRVIPDLTVGDNITKLANVEAAKRRLIANLGSLGLEVWSKEKDPTTGLAFEVRSPVGDDKVLTGHDAGVITLNLDEADPVLREKQRCELGEAYRTILGHLRHEIGHYFFDRLIVDDGKETEFRSLFGDERADYAQALGQHYENGPKPNWAEEYISPYAASHPWEDWAETWAHYLHAYAVAETARRYHIAAPDSQVESGTVAFLRGSIERKDFEAFLAFWDGLAVTINELNRSLGVNEPYPFQWTPTVIEKLFFVHCTIRGRERVAQAA